MATDHDTTQPGPAASKGLTRGADGLLTLDLGDDPPDYVEIRTDLLHALITEINTSRRARRTPTNTRRLRIG